MKACNRLPSKRDVRPVLVTLNNLPKKSTLVRWAKECKTQGIFINEHLTKYTANLFKAVREMKIKEGVPQFVWIRD